MNYVWEGEKNVHLKKTVYVSPRCLFYNEIKKKKKKHTVDYNYYF